MKTAKEIYEAAENMIYEIVLDGKASASFDGRSYTAADLDKLRKISDYYRKLAIERGEIESAESVIPTVSYPIITEQVPTC